MPTETPPDAAADAAVPAKASSVRRVLFWLAACLTLIWIAFLAALAFRTPNPPVVNRIQIRESDGIFVGRWDSRADGRFRVTDELKHGTIRGIVTVVGVPDCDIPETDLWVIPVRRSGGTFVVTQGLFETGLENPPQPADQPPPLVRIQPQCYRATEAILEQVRKLVEQPPPVDRR